MKESHRKGVANHPGPESCVGSRKAAGEALTGAHAGWVLSCEIIATGVPTSFRMAEGNTDGCAIASIKHPQDSAQSQTPSMYGNSTRENRETPSTPVVEGVTGRLEKALSQKSNTHVDGESGSRSTDEVPEQRWKATGAGYGGKATDQGEHRAGDRAPDAEPDQRAERLARCA